MKQLTLLFAALLVHLYVGGQVKGIQPFTGAMTIENGIRYDQLKITIDDYLLLTPDIPQGKELVIKITKPWSFEKDASGNAHPGIGFWITDKSGKMLGKTENIYKDDKEGFNPDYLSALSFSITLDDKMKINDSIIIYAKFYDQLNNDSLLVIIPSRVVAKGDEKVINTWSSFSSTYGATGMFINCSAEEFHMQKTYLEKETATSADTIQLSIKSLGDFTLKDDQFFLNSRYILYDQNFNIIETKELFPGAEQGITASQLKNIKQSFILPTGFHRGIARLLIQDANSSISKLDAVLNFVY